MTEMAKHAMALTKVTKTRLAQAEFVGGKLSLVQLRYLLKEAQFHFISFVRKAPSSRVTVPAIAPATGTASQFQRLEPEEGIMLIRMLCDAVIAHFKFLERQVVLASAKEKLLAKKFSICPKRNLKKKWNPVAPVASLP
jgi:hypothetical protein